MKHRPIFFPFALTIMLVALSLACGKSATPAVPPTSTPASPTAVPVIALPAVALGEEMELPEQGFAFRPIPGYQLDTGFGVQMLAAEADPDMGPAFMLAGGAAAPGTTAQSLIDSLASSEVTVSKAEPVDVAGEAGLSAEIRRSTGNLAGRAVVVMVTPEQQFIFFGVAPQAEWEEEISGLFEAVLGSVRFIQMTAPVEPTPEPPPAVELAEIRQWAATASASSEYGSSSWSAAQACGAPDVSTCGDNSDAWAAESSSTIEWIELAYGVPVEPTQVNVHISYNPTYITRMELVDTNGTYHQIYAFEARAYPECPYIFSIDVTETGFQAVAVKITIDQTTAPSWVEIDAVELVGLGDASLLPVVTEAVPPEPTFETPAGFLWRLGGVKGFDTNGQFPGLWGMDYDPANDLLFIADAVYDIQVLDSVSLGPNPEGHHQGSFEHDAMRVPQDVKVDGQGNVYVAAWSSGNILVFPPTGGEEPLLSFGEHGPGDGQFGDFGPSYVAVGLDGRIYTMDTNVDDAGDYYDRIQIFSAAGEWQQTFLADEWCSPAGMDISSDGNLYVACFLGSNVMQYSPDGELMGELGEDAIRSVSGAPQAIALDAENNIYLALWTGGIVKLDALGNLVAQWGIKVEDGEQPWPAGGFYQPAGIAVTPDGSIVFFSDTSGMYTYVTAFRFGE